MSYREAFQAPLVSYIGGNLVALDRQSGALLWRQPFEGAPARLLVVGRMLFVAMRSAPVGPSKIHVLDLETGVPSNPIQVDFGVTIAVHHEGRIYFAGARGLLAIDTSGRTLFRIDRVVETQSAWSGDTFLLVATNAARQELWRMPSPTGGWVEAALAIDGVVAQPDFEG